MLLWEDPQGSGGWLLRRDRCGPTVWGCFVLATWVTGTVHASYYEPIDMLFHALR